MKCFDLRSDTITKPTEAMRKAMYEAEVGDDVYREDPTTNRLELLGAQLSGKERSLFVSSGSMGNLISLYINGGRSNEVLTASNSHIIQHEIGSVAAIAGVLPIGIDVPRGILTASDLAGKVKRGCYDMATTTLVEVENTIGGFCYPLENLEEIRDFADSHQLLVHMDGARIFNAQVATGIPVKTYAKYADTLTFCLSKGLGAPVGSLLCGDEAFINKALTIRKMLGGGIRQSGILAAAGLYALENHVERLQDDHLHAQAIASALEKAGWAQVDKLGVQTNIIFFTVQGYEATDIVKQLAAIGILANNEGPMVRLVTNLDLSDEDTDALCKRLETFTLGNN
ncbi:threonine aldolase [Sphaerochaeta pleomorpha str. Grapes]|uniref:Threonine aldolase n=1 Tax=Sphaerochaeta pleomorpha (strain ATCC BAA-1885 / DSM 22778 / Grapes) TaxID=158190 RepID=G8QUQ9_SPHPG|nr:GntG family PLP-dependent aldolase [Sphaerochaeta pleomorpha]AEV30367.1 threonine aldolase [Sphaerochaeta pleomorpha str. Grapes]